MKLFKSKPILALWLLSIPNVYAGIIESGSNVDTFLAQDMCIQNTTTYKEYGTAIEWARSGLFSDQIDIFSGGYKLLARTLLDCIDNAKILLDNANNKPLGKTLTDYNQDDEFRYSYLLSHGTPGDLANIAEKLHENERVEEAAIFLEAAYQRAKKPTDIRRMNSFWRHSSINTRLSISKLDYELGDFHAAQIKAEDELQLRNINVPEANATDLLAIIGASKAALQKTDESYGSLKRLLNQLVEAAKKEIRFSFNDRESKLTQNVAGALQSLVGIAYKKYYKNPEKLGAADLAFQASQLLSIGEVSSAFEYLTVTSKLREAKIAFDFKNFKIEQDAYDNRMAVFENSFSEYLKTNETDKAIRLRELYVNLKDMRGKLFAAAKVIEEFKEERLGSIEPLSFSEIQSELGDDETMIYYWQSDDLNESSLWIWAIDKKTVNWAKTEFQTGKFEELVLELRCGLDSRAYSSDECARYSQNQSSSESIVPNADPIFSIKTSQSLHDLLFPETIWKHINPKLTIIPSKNMLPLPINTLIESNASLPETIQNFEKLKIPWVFLSHEITLLPSLYGLTTRGSLNNQSISNSSLLSFGNPLLKGENHDGSSSDSRYSLAKSYDNCGTNSSIEWADSSFYTSKLNELTTEKALPKIPDLDKLLALPETRDEVCFLAEKLRPKEARIFLGEHARETVIKMMHENLELESVDIVHIASHALLDVKIDGKSEAGIVFTPPSKATKYDDGFLTSSEIASLNLPAKIAILSACNTGRSNDQTISSLTGLTRAFFLAGVENLVVSHWEVDSEAAVALMQLMSTYTERGAKSSDLVANLHKAMEDLAILGVHPSKWAPFFVVGHGI